MAVAGAGERHLVETGMTYDAHRRRAWHIGGALLTAGAACIVHGLLPGLFTDKATKTITRLNDEIKAGHSQPGEPVLLEFEI